MDKNGVKLSISGFDLTEIPSRLFRMTSLTDVDLSNNLIQNLKCLYLSSNRLETLPDEIYGLTKLEILDLSHNQILNLSPLVSQIGR